MASTYSSNIRLELMASGENDSTWGTKTNTNLQLLEAAIAGRSAVTHDDTANYTLTTANGSADEARRMILNIGGALSAARNVVCPTQAKFYVVKNATTGGYAVTLKTSAGTGIAVPNGKTMMLFCDGTNVVESIDQVVGNFAVGGTLSVTGATTLSAALTYGGVALSNAVTGTGNMVLSTSPTLVTPLLGTPTSGVLTNCTGLPIAGTTGYGTGVATALAVNVGSAGAFLTFNGDAGTPSALVGTNISGTAASLTAGVASAVAASGITGTTLAAGVVTSSLTTVGALNAGSITNGFGSIDVGADAISGGAISGTVLTASSDMLVGSGTIQAWQGPVTKYGSKTYSGQLDVNASSYFTNNAYYDGTNWRTEADDLGGILTIGAAKLEFRTATSGGALGITTPVLRFEVADTGILTLSAYGAGTATFSSAGVISSVSDERLKIKDGVITDPIPMLMGLEPGYFYGKPEANMGDARQLGFYAQNVRKAIGPEAAPDPLDGRPWGYFDRSVLAVVVEASKNHEARLRAIELNQ